MEKSIKWNLEKFRTENFTLSFQKDHKADLHESQTADSYFFVISSIKGAGLKISADNHTIQWERANMLYTRALAYKNVRFFLFPES